MVTAQDVGVRFYFDRHRKVVTPMAARFRREGPIWWGVRKVSFAISRGEGVALIGGSGSGKTTILRLLARVYLPDEGALSVRGRVGSLLSVDAGLLALLTGRENAMLLGALFGLSRAESRNVLDSIKERSQLGDAFEHPVSAYSQGMRARLGLAVAEEVHPDVLVLDEVHEALDHEFRGVLEKRAHSLIERGGVVVAAGHDHPMLARFCSRAIWLRDGNIQADGPFDVVQPAYLAAIESTPV
jgi:ABC-type polysaccharide/polyol phosphate transport system ATPase subunit